MKSGTAQRRLRWLTGLGLALTAGAVVMSAGSASAATAPSGYDRPDSWSNGTATLPDPYSGTVTMTGSPGQTRTDSTGVRLYPTDPADWAGCLDGHSGQNGEDNVADCGRTYTATLTFSTPVQNPVLRVIITGGVLSLQDKSFCTEAWENVTVGAVNGAAPSGLSLASPLDSDAAWSNNTLSMKDSAVGQCSDPMIAPQFIKVPGTVTSISFTYTVRAKTTAWDGRDPIGVAPIGGVYTDVYLAPPSTDFAVVKTVTTAPAHVGDPIAYSIKVTNNGPDTALAWTMTDPIPSGISNAATTTPGCSIAGGTLTCTGTNGASGASRTVTLTGTASTTGTIANTATVSTTGTDPNPGNNSSTATVTVLDSPVASPWVLGGVVGVAGLGLLSARRRSARTTA